jgi:hypothetical protein
LECFQFAAERKKLPAGRCSSQLDRWRTERDFLLALSKLKSWYENETVYVEAAG